MAVVANYHMPLTGCYISPLFLPDEIFNITQKLYTPSEIFSYESLGYVYRIGAIMKEVFCYFERQHHFTST